MSEKMKILLPTFVTLWGIAVLCGLGFWQLHRLEWKTELLQQLDSEYEKDASQIFLTPDELDKDFLYKRGTLRGTYDFNKQILVGPRTYQHLPGRHVYTPMRLENGTIILVNRGWVPNEWTFETETDAERSAAQNKKITGLLRKVPEHNPFMPENKPEKGQWYFADIDQIATAKNIPGLHKVIFYLEGNDAEGSYPVAQATKPELPNDHLQYAVFWFTMAGVLVVIYTLRFLKKEKKNA